MNEYFIVQKYPKANKAVHTIYIMTAIMIVIKIIKWLMNVIKILK